MTCGTSREGDYMSENPRRKRGGNVKKAPAPGLLTRGEAIRLLRIPPSTFDYQVKIGRITRVPHPSKSDGYYKKDEIEMLALENVLLFLQNASEPDYEPTTFSTATPDDIPGIFRVIAQLWGEKLATPIELRKSWYKINPRIDYIVKQNGIVVGYLNIIPYTPETMEEMMAGRKRGWNIRDHDILPFESGGHYDCFIGIAIRSDFPHSTRYGRRLISGFMGVLEQFAQEGIYIKKLHAVSDQPEGIEIANKLGFVKEPAREGDLFGRYVLDLEKPLEDLPRPNAFVAWYQDAIKQTNKKNQDTKK